jgi:hypothetical protein
MFRVNTRMFRVNKRKAMDRKYPFLCRGGGGERAKEIEGVNRGRMSA